MPKGYSERKSHNYLLKKKIDTRINRSISGNIDSISVERMRFSDDVLCREIVTNKLTWKRQNNSQKIIISYGITPVALKISLTLL